MGKIIKQVEYYDRILIDGRFDTRGNPTGDNEGTLICRRFIVKEAESGVRRLVRETFTVTIKGETNSEFTKDLERAIKGRYQFPKKYSDNPNLIREFIPPQIKPYLERTITYAK